MFQELGQCFLIGLSCSILFYYFSLPLISVYGFVLWGRCLRTNRVYITLSLALPTFKNNNNEITAGLSLTCHHLHSAVPALS